MYWITGILGLLLVIAPFVLSYTFNPLALWTSLILGAAVVIVSVIKGLAHDANNWEYWLAGLFGLVAVVAPFILSFSAIATALWTSIVLGLIIAILAGYQIFAHSTQIS